MENNSTENTGAGQENLSKKEIIVQPETLKEEALKEVADIDASVGIFEDRLKEDGYSEEEIKTTEESLGATNELAHIHQEADQIKNEIKSVEQNSEKIPEDFKFNAKRLFNSLAKEEQSAMEGYIYTVGQFKEKTSSGKNLLIDSILYHKNSDMFDLYTDAMNLVLVAKDLETNSITGLRLSTVDNKPKSFAANTLDYDAHGFIVTKSKGTGVASALDRAYEQALKQVVNQRDAQSEEIYQGQIARDPKLAEEYKRRPEQITWSVENKNLEELLKLKNKLRHASEENDTENIERLRKQIEDKQAEQARWQALYGEGGKLGMKMANSGSETFSPGEHYTRPKYEKVILPDHGVKDSKMKSIDPNEFKQILTDLKKIID